MISDNGRAMTVNEEPDLVRSCVETAQAYLDDECKPPYVPANRHNAWTRVIFNCLAKGEKYGYKY
jgi:hypothetical protein